MTTAEVSDRPGFQGSERSGVEVTIYPKQGSDLVLRQERDVITFMGRTAADVDGSIVSVSTSKSMGPPSGKWSITIKPSRNTQYPDLRELIADDDWIDIVFKRHGKAFHTMRGMVDEVRRNRQATGDGTTVTSYLITGRDFGRVWEGTPVWYNRFRQENLGGAESVRIFGGNNRAVTVPKAVEGILFGFIASLGDVGRALWEPPRGIVNTVSGSFTHSVVQDMSKFLLEADRTAVAVQLMDPQGAGVWELAKEWSDPGFCELWADLLNPDTLGILDQEVPLGDAAMHVMLRDIPYPTLTTGLDGPWFQLPMLTIPRQAVVTHDIGRSGFERFNSFFVGPEINQDFGINRMVDLAAPLWDTDDMLVHGMRRYDINTHYAMTAGQGDLFTITRDQRRRVRDWYCLNPYFYNGTIELARGFPELKIGMKLRIAGVTGQDDQETYYVEGVNHSWAFGKGMRTSVQVTRGWIGTDDSLLSALEAVASGYTGDDVSSATGTFLSMAPGTAYA